MSRKMIVIHRVIFFSSILILAASLVFYLTKWNGLPDEIGIHFASDGEFDVEAEKLFGFYPHAAGGLLIGIFALAHYLIEKIKSGLKISGNGEKIFKTIFHFTLDALSVLFSLFFANWSRSVALQVPLNVNFVLVLVTLMLTVSAAGIITGIIIYQKYKIKKENSESPKLFHKVCRLTAWLLTAVGIAMLLIMWDRIPSAEEFYFDPEYRNMAYFENFGAYLDKRLLIVPHAVIAVLLAVIEIISVKAVKNDKNALIAHTDRLKLISGMFFFWWNMLLVNESGIGIVSPSLFVLLFSASFVIYIVKKKRGG